MLDAGFETVYQLRGGVLRYLAEVPEEDSLWRGECFVFDRRVSLGRGLRMGMYRECHGCKAPVSEEARRTPLYETDVLCPACRDALIKTRREGLRERVRQTQFAASRCFAPRST